MDQSLVWTIPNSGGDIEIYIPGKKRVIHKISGGADSAILLYILAKYRNDFNPDIKFDLATSVNQQLPYQEIFAKKVIQYVNSVQPLGDFIHHVNTNLGDDDYNLGQDRVSEPLHNLDNIEEGYETMQWTGITLNPPKDEMKANKMWDIDRVFARDPVPQGKTWKDHAIEISEKNMIAYVENLGATTAVVPSEDYPAKHYEMDGQSGVFKYQRPFRNHHKRHIAELYNTFNVMDDLFPLTRSCEKVTTDFSLHCGKCWFCKERKWGFGPLDAHLDND